MEYQIDNPNERYSTTYLGTWSSMTDIDTFFSRFNHSSGYKDGDTKLSLGNYVIIDDGTYNAIWEIAGFDMESNRFAADGTTFDNGYGICMIPQKKVTSGKWNSTSTTSDGYIASTMHTTLLPTIVSNLQNVLGNHIVNRNVLLSSSTTNSSSNAYTWTTSYATLMSIGQMTGTFASNSNKYDDGEANYKLPLFNYEDYRNGSEFWSWGIRSYSSSTYTAWYVNSSSFGSLYLAGSAAVRPLIYLR